MLNVAILRLQIRKLNHCSLLHKRNHTATINMHRLQTTTKNNKIEISQTTFQECGSDISIQFHKFVAKDFPFINGINQHNVSSGQKNL